MRGTQVTVLMWIALALWGYGASGAEESFYARKEEGWFWRELVPEPPEPPEVARPPEKAPDPPKPLPAQAQKSLQSPEPLSPAWLREKLPDYRDRAIDNPSPQNVRAYYYLQRYAMDKAERFAEVAQQVVLADPALDENTRRPISSFGGQVFDSIAHEHLEQVARKVATSAGVWYFFRSDCPFCRAEDPVLDRLRNRIGLVVLPISIDGKGIVGGAFEQFVPDRGHARELGVTQTPTLFLVREGSQFVLISEGLMSEDELLERIVLAAHEAGWISDEEFNSTLPRKPRPTWVVGKVDEHIDPEDPAQLINWLSSQEGDYAKAIDGSETAPGSPQ